MNKNPILFKKTLVIGILLLFIVMNTNTLISGNSLKKSYNTFSYTPHDPIYIDGNYEFTSENGVTGGMGWVNDPYIIEGWEINASSENGITIIDTNKCFEIRNCYIHGGGSSKDGIVFLHVMNGVINSSIISNNRFGIIFRQYDYYIGEDSSNNKILKNTITNNKRDGIHFEHTLSDYHSYNKIFLNEISYNDQGIFLIMSAYNKIFSNKIVSNSEWGVNLTMCMGGGQNNKVYHNNFIGNNNENGQACSMWTTGNDWDDGYPSGGNFWSDYEGIDSDGDGIGDTPYEIPIFDEYGYYENDYDYYPLMEPWGGNLPPFAEFSWMPYYPNPGEMVIFNASGSIDYDGYIILYEWDWDNDGIYDENYSSPFANFTFEEYGYYPVTLVVYDNESENDTITKTVRIGNQPPVAVDDYFEVYDNSEENIIDVLANDYDPDDDDLTIESVTDPLHGTVVNHGDYVIYTPDPDFYGFDEFSYTIIDDHGGTSSATVFITVIDFNSRPNKPYIDGPPTGKPGEEYCLIVHSTDPDGDDLMYLIDWGDGTTSGWLGPFPQCEPVEVCHTFKKGIYLIRAKARDVYGEESDWSDSLEIEMPRGRINFYSLFNCFYDRFPILERILSFYIFNE